MHLQGVCLLLTLPLVQGEPPPAVQIETFKQSMAALKGVHEKARAIQTVGALAVKDPAWIPLLSPYLAPAASDIDLLLPVAAMDALGRFRGQAQAAQVLGRALPAFQKVPWLFKRLLVSLARVSHPSVIPVFEGYLRGSDAQSAVLALQTLAEMPPTMALDVLFQEWERVQQSKEKASPERKAVQDRLGPEFYKLAKALSGENYPSMKELALWWQKRGPSFKEKAAEEERTSIISDVSATSATLPPVLMVELLFEEAGGGEFLNTGASSVRSGRVSLSKPAPARSISTAWGKGRNTRSIDFGKKASAAAMDAEIPPDFFKGVASFTICGWINPRIDAEGSGGSRLVSWLGPDQSGVELVFRAGGFLQLGINELAAGSPSKSPSGQLPPVDEKLDDAVDRNWRFFAVTYDSGAPSGHVQFYLGSTTKDAIRVATCDYKRGVLGPKSLPMVSIGNVPPTQRMTVTDGLFRGLLDDVRVFGSRHDGTGALTLQEIVRVQDHPPAPKKP